MNNDSSTKIISLTKTQKCSPNRDGTAKFPNFKLNSLILTAIISKVILEAKNLDHLDKMFKKPLNYAL